MYSDNHATMQGRSLRKSRYEFSVFHDSLDFDGPIPYGRSHEKRQWRHEARKQIRNENHDD